MVHTQNKSLMICDWVELVLPDGRTVAPPMPFKKDGWKEVKSFEWPEKYEARVRSSQVSVSGVHIHVNSAIDVTEGLIVWLDSVFMHDMASIIKNEAVFARRAKRFERVVSPPPIPERYNDYDDYFCPSKTPLQGKWPNYHPSGMVKVREE